MVESVDRETEKLLDLLRKELNLDRSLASMRADIGLQLLRVKLALQRERRPWGDWLARQRDLARERGLTPLADTTVRAYIRMARFRHAHPDLASRYLTLDPWALCAVLTLPRETLQDFAKCGVPLPSGERSPLADATVRQLRWAARLARARAKGLEAAPEPAPARRGARAPIREADPVRGAIALLRQAGRLDRAQLEEVIGAVLDVAGVRAPETTRRQIAATIAGAAAPALPAGAAAGGAPVVADALERLVPVSEGAEADPPTLARLIHAIAGICAGVARGTKRRPA